MTPSIEFLSGVLVVSEQPKRLADFTQMSDAWFSYLEARRANGQDVISRWRAAS